MKKQVSVISVIVGILAVTILAQTEESKMYLCLDSMTRGSNDGKSSVKMVYGYINGKKTECMSEYDFKAKYLKAEFDGTQATQPDSDKILESKQLKRELPKLDPAKMVTIGRKDLAGLDFKEHDLKGVNLENADLHNANLDYADLRGANLKNANLKGASLQSAFCKGANFEGADLTGAKLEGVYFQSAKLKTVKGLTPESITAVRTFYEAEMDTAYLELVKARSPKKLLDPGWSWDRGKKGEKVSDIEKADPKKNY